MDNRIVNLKGISPTNYKSSTLILNKYRKIDIIIMIFAGAWLIVSILLMFLVFEPNLIYLSTVVIILPMFLIGVVQPVPYYHNQLEFLILSIKYRIKPKRFTSIITNKKG